VVRSSASPGSRVAPPEGDDLYGVINTLLPALLCLGLWRVAVWRRDR
jgi:hypothetical protein